MLYFPWKQTLPVSFVAFFSTLFPRSVCVGGGGGGGGWGGGGGVFDRDLEK